MGVEEKEINPPGALHVTCLCLETFPEGDRPYIHMTPPRVVDVEGHTEQTSMVCCNKCWLAIPMAQRSVLSLLTTPAKSGGLGIGSLVYERFWPDLLRPPIRQPPDTKPADDEFEILSEQGPPLGTSSPPGSEVSRMIDGRNASRGGSTDG